MPLNLVNIAIQYNTDGRPSGDADVDFATHEDAVEAMKKHRALMRKSSPPQGRECCAPLFRVVPAVIDHCDLYLHQRLQDVGIASTAIINAIVCHLNGRCLSTTSKAVRNLVFMFYYNNFKPLL